MSFCSACGDNVSAGQPCGCAGSVAILRVCELEARVEALEGEMGGYIKGKGGSWPRGNVPMPGTASAVDAGAHARLSAVDAMMKESTAEIANWKRRALDAHDAGNPCPDYPRLVQERDVARLERDGLACQVENLKASIGVLRSETALPPLVRAVVDAAYAWDRISWESTPHGHEDQAQEWALHDALVALSGAK